MPHRQVEAARQVFEHLAKIIDAPFSLRLWDGTTIPLGRDAAGGPCIEVARPGVLGALFRRPTLCSGATSAATSTSTAAI